MRDKRKSLSSNQLFFGSLLLTYVHFSGNTIYVETLKIVFVVSLKIQDGLQKFNKFEIMNAIVKLGHMSNGRMVRQFKIKFAFINLIVR